MDFSILLLLALVVVFVFSAFNSRIKKLENEIKTIKESSGIHGVSYSATLTSAVPMQATTTPPSHDVSSITARPVQSAPVSEKATGTSWNEAFSAWIKEDWLLKLGAFIILLGFGWFVSYAFAHNWIGPFGRITLGMILGIGILGFGWVRMHTHARQGSVFLGLGAMILLVSAFSASYVYHLIPARGSLGIMFLTSAFIALASVRFKVLSLSVTSIIIAGLAPTTLLLNATPTYTELFAYLFVIVLGTVWVVSLTGWRNLTAVALTIFFLYSLPHLGAATPESGTLLVFAYAFALLFFITNTVGILKIRDGDIKPDAITAAGNGLLLLAWIMMRAPQEWKSLIIIGWMALFVIVAFVIFAMTKRREPFFVYAGVGVAMLAAATAAELDGAALTTAYIIESAIIPFIAYAIMSDRGIAKSLTLLTLGPGILSLRSIFFADWQSSIPFEHFFVLLLMTAALLLLGVFFATLPRTEEKTPVSQHLFVVGSMYGYILLWLSLHAFMVDKDTATMASLVVYTVIGLITYAYGKARAQKGIHYYGGALLGFTVGHLLLIDVWNMALSGRIVTFFVVGTLLMMTAFMGRKKYPTAPQI